MTWRDLDIYLAMPEVSVALFLELGQRLAVALSPRKASYTDHLNFPATKGVPGLYWGIHTGPLNKGGWQIDLWGVSTDVCNERVQCCERMVAAMNEETRQSILLIKNVVCRHPEYRNTVTSQDVYSAVMSGGANTVEQFWSYKPGSLARRG